MVVLFDLTPTFEESFEVFETERETDQNYTFRALLEGKKEQNRNRKFVMEFVRTLGQKDGNRCKVLMKLYSKIKRLGILQIYNYKLN